MKNRRGKSIEDRLNEDIEYAAGVANNEHREILAIKALGAADLAVEFNLITYAQWETVINRIFNLM